MYNHYHRHSYGCPTRLDIHEYRAPTDESVRLLKEMESKSEEKIVNSIKVGNTDIELVIHKEFDGLSGSDFLISVTRINNKSIMVKTVQDYKDDSISLLKKHIEDVGKRIALEILAPAYSSLPKDF